MGLCSPSSTELGAERARAPHGTGSRLLFTSNRRATELDQAPVHASPRRSQPPGFRRRLPEWEQAQASQSSSHFQSSPANAWSSLQPSLYRASFACQVSVLLLQLRGGPILMYIMMVC